MNGREEEDLVLFVGTGCTGAIHKMIEVMGLYWPSELQDRFHAVRELPAEERPVVLVSNMEHHSNEVSWRESLADTVRLRPGEDGMPDVDHIKACMDEYAERPLKIASLSAGSNVTGMRPRLEPLCELLHERGWTVLIDYAGAGAYVGVDMRPAGRPQGGGDALFFSPHKFVGGPGACGVLVARRGLFRNRVPSVPGGGTVAFVWAGGQEYEPHPEHREEGGTPGIMQSIRAGLAFGIKARVGAARIEELEQRHVFRALDAWKEEPNLELVGASYSGYWNRDRLSIVSFNVRVHTDCGRRLVLHPHFVAQLLNDVYGIQARSGCSCAGPYGIDLLCVGGEDSDTLLSLARRGYHAVKPGWVRVNFNYFLTDAEVDFVVAAVQQVARHGWKLLPLYSMDPRSGQWFHHTFQPDSHVHSLAGGAWMDEVPSSAPRCDDDPTTYLAAAQRIYDGAATAVEAHLDAIHTFHTAGDSASSEAGADAVWPADAERLRAFAVPSELVDRLLHPDITEPAVADTARNKCVNFYAGAPAHDAAASAKYAAHIRRRSKAFLVSRPRG